MDKSGLSVELQLPKRWRVHNVFHTSSLLEPCRDPTNGLHSPPVDITKRKGPDKSVLDKSSVEHKIGYNVDGQRAYEGFFNVDEIMGSQYNIKKVLYLIKWEEGILTSPNGLRSLLGIWRGSLFNSIKGACSRIQ